jgi:hypothetical protein
MSTLKSKRDAASSLRQSKPTVLFLVPFLDSLGAIIETAFVIRFD